MVWLPRILGSHTLGKLLTDNEVDVLIDDVIGMGHNLEEDGIHFIGWPLEDYPTVHVHITHRIDIIADVITESAGIAWIAQYIEEDRVYIVTRSLEYHLIILEGITGP